MKRIFIIIAIITAGYFQQLMGQTGPATAPVEYEVVYNVNTCLYEAHAHVLSGTLVIPFTIPFPSNFTIVIPESLPNGPIPVVQQVQPTGMSWANSNSVYAPAADPIHDFHMFSIPGGGAGNAYTTFSGGDDILLFTFSIPHSTCEEGIRVFINGTDPASSAPGMDGLNLSNSLKTFNPTYALGSEQYISNRNNTGIILPKPTPAPSFICEEEQISLFANPPVPYPACLGPLTYSWTGPDGFSSTEENPIISTAGWDVAQKDAAAGTYTVTVTDGNGCTAQAGVLVDETNCIELPIELLSFDAIKSGETVITRWVTLNELDNAYFEVERSEDGKEFHTISEEISGAGTTLEKQNYSWVDMRPLVGVNYYRLKQVDYDAGYTYSRVRSVVFEGKDVPMRLYPNPARNEVTLSTGVKRGEVTLMIYGPNGQIVSNQRYEPGDWKTSTRLDFENMVEGMYMIVLKERNYSETARFVKVR